MILPVIDSKNVFRKYAEVRAQTTTERVHLTVTGPDDGLYADVMMSAQEAMHLAQELLIATSALVTMMENEPR